MNGIISFFSGLLLGGGFALFIHIKNKWIRDDLVKTKAQLKTKEVVNELLAKKLPITPAARVKLLNALESGNYK